MTDQKHIFELSSYSFIDVTGVDVDRFLQGQLTINVETPQPKKAFLASLCNPKGRVVSLFFMAKINAGYRLYLPKSLQEKTVEQLRKYAVFFKVVVNVANEDTPLLATKGLTFSQVDELMIEHQLVDYACINGTDLSIIIPCSEQQTPPLTHRNNIARQFSLQIVEQDSGWYWALAMLEIPWITIATSEQFLPHNLNLPSLGAVDFNKGCFTGQEVIARMQYKGKLKQHLARFKGDGSYGILPGGVIQQAGKKVAEVICVAINLEKEVLVLALLKDSAEQDESFQLICQNSPILELTKN